MYYTFLFLAMIFFHIVDDYYLQGWLASAKQKSWWEKNAPDFLYRNDYLMALVEHAFSWTFMIHIPLIIFSYCYDFDIPVMIIIGSFMFNLGIHTLVDDLKANKKKINLIQDQVCHLSQIIITFIMYMSCYN